MRKIVIIKGSPRKGGNTDILADAFIEGIDRNKYEISIISAAGIKVGGCTGCNACYANESHCCVIKDDMQELYRILADADIIATATPIYFYGITSQLKSIIDRLHNPVRNEFKVKKLILMMVCADNIPSVFDSAEMMFKSILEYFSLENGGIIKAPGIENKGDIKGKPVLAIAKRLAEKL